MAEQQANYNGQSEYNTAQQKRLTYTELFWKNNDVPIKDKLQMAGSIGIASTGLGGFLAGDIAENDSIYVGGIGATFLGVFGAQIVNHRAMRNAELKSKSEYLRNGGVITVWQRKK